MHGPTDYSSCEAKNELYCEVSRVHQRVRSGDIPVVFGDFKTKFGCLAMTERYTRSQLSVSKDCAGNRGRLYQVCYDHGLFLVNNIFYHK